MARSRDSFLEDLIGIASRLPWYVALGLAVASYLVLHLIASQPIPQLTAVAPGNIQQAMSDTIGRTAIFTLSAVLQYVLPLIFSFGALVSAIRRRQQGNLHAQVVRTPEQATLDAMTWRQFEDLVAAVFRRKGFTVVERGGSAPDGGVDLELRIGTDHYLVQCKRWKTTKVGVATVRELYGVMSAEGAVGGFVVSSGEFTAEAKRFAEGRSIEVVPASLLLGMIQEGHTGTPEKASSSLGLACPECGGGMERRVAKRGRNAGKQFWGCRRFPACKGIRQILV